MITSAEFPLLTYKKPHLEDNRPAMQKIVGMDSEAYMDGKPFMFCTSLKDTITPENLLQTIFSEKYINSNFMLYNMKYDSGAILLSLLNDKALYNLWRDDEVTFNGHTYEYIPHKMLRITRSKKEKITFWDIAQFYKSSLDNAAKTYLNKSKKDIRTKNFTRKYVARFWNSISEYCIHDAMLTAELGEYLIKKFLEFEITASAIYSQASISFKYFTQKSKINTVWRFWKYDKDLLRFACDAYAGGKFEVTARGSTYAHEFDLTSAYPYEIRNLVDITRSEVIRSKNYQSGAVYAFIRVYIENYSGVHLPCGPGLKNTAVKMYPAGAYFLTITLNEYDYIKRLKNVRIEIIDGKWIFVPRKIYPYRKTIDYLFAIKDQYKKTDRMLYNNVKVVMNGFYGKMAQCIEQNDGSIAAGQGWHPMHAAVITANTRLKVTALQNRLKAKCLAVHTDSVFITCDKLPKNTPINGLGKFEHVVSGDTILIACGMYQINKTCAFKGIKPRNGDTWKTILSKNKNKSKIPYPLLHVESWREAMARNHGVNTINVFSNETKIIDLNCDIKRSWPRGKIRAKSLLENLEQSTPKIYVENEPPKIWKKF